jgi:RimJ/RimL family protein N-acetyltransferase
MRQFVFATPRLVARRWTGAEVEDLFAVYGDAVAVRWVGDGRPITLPECEQWVGVTLANYQKRGYGMFALEEKPASRVIGFCGIVHPGDQVEPEVKYALRRSHWGRGLATEAVLGLLAYGAEAHGLSQIIATTAPDNAASHRVLLKSGFRVGELRLNDDGSQTQLFVWRSATIAA